MKILEATGFTLLELLLVVGIAAILIVAGVTTYSMVNKSNSINEATRLLNTIMNATRRLYSNSTDYGTTSNVIETAMYNTGNVPEKYKSSVVGRLITPFDTGPNAIMLTGDTTAGQFRLSVIVPPAYAPELAANFDPNASLEITGITVCGTAVNDGTALNVATLSATCGDTTTVPTAGNFVIRSR